MNRNELNRRELMQRLGITATTAGIVSFLPSLASARSPLRNTTKAKQRIIWVFSPNGIIQDAFWPKETGAEFELPEILKPLEPFMNKTLVLKGIDNRVRGDGDDHMRGMSCLLTAIELFPGNIQGGGNTPAGWPQGHSIDQELKQFLQNNDATRTRFGSLELGVLVPDRADVWTRWVYTGPNRPVAPISNPKQLFKKLFGDPNEAKLVRRVTDVVAGDLARLRGEVSAADRRMLDEHLQSIREMERRLEGESLHSRIADPPQVDLEVPLEAANMPDVSAVQQDLLVAAFKSDQARLATLQYDTAVGNIKMSFLGINEGHHELSHDPDDKKESMEKLIKIDRWYCEQIARLASRLSETPEPDGNGTLLDNTTIIWTNELGKGNSHTLNDIPFVLVGGGLGLKSGHSFAFQHVAHNRLWLTLAAAIGHPLKTFGSEKLSHGGVIDELLAK
jgi:Protein of unknown function (DUF1552)